MEDRVDTLEAALDQLKEDYPTAYVTQTEFHRVMLLIHKERQADLEALADKIGLRVDGAFSKHQKDHDRIDKDVRRNEDRIDSLRNVGAVIASAATAFGIWLGVR